MKPTACIGCGAQVPDVEGPTFRYPESSSPGCWAAFGDVQAKEAANPRPRTRRLAVDAYAVQHPGTPTPQTIQSVTVHLAALHCVLERGQDIEVATRTMARLIERHKAEFDWLEPPCLMGAPTVMDVVGAEDPDELERRVEAWARASWAAWSCHHPAIRAREDRLYASA